MGMNDINNVASSPDQMSNPPPEGNRPISPMINGSRPSQAAQEFNDQFGWLLGPYPSEPAPPGAPAPQGNFGVNQQQYSYGYNGSYGSPSNNGTPSEPPVPTPTPQPPGPAPTPASPSGSPCSVGTPAYSGSTDNAGQIRQASPGLDALYAYIASTPNADTPLVFAAEKGPASYPCYVALSSQPAHAAML